MPRNISFMLTQEQFRDRSKTVTRRLGWRHVKVGDILNACEKCQGLKKGETVKVMGQIEVTHVSQDIIGNITKEDTAREGFPQWQALQFVQFFCKHNKCDVRTHVTRIEFKYLDEVPQP